MKPTKHRHIVLSLILLACSFANHANATECKQSDLLSECLRSFMEATKKSAPDPSAATAAFGAAAEKQARKTVKESVTSLPTPGNNSSPQTLTDFLALFGAAATTDGSGDDKKLVVDLNNIVGLPNANYKLRAILREPTLYVPLKEALTDAGLNDEATALSDSLGDFDDTELELQVSPEWFGTRRELDRYRDVLSSLVGALTSEVPDSDIQLEREVLDFLSARHVTGQLNTVTIGDLPASAQSEFKTLLSRYAAARIAVEGELRSRFGARRLDSFADLLNNEPQLIIRTSGRLRDRVAGPNEFVVEAKYELGFAHLSELLEDCSSGSAEFDWRSSKALDCYQKYVSDAGEIVGSKSRVSIAAKYRFVDSYQFRRPYLSDGLTEKEAHLLNVEVALGRYFDIGVGAHNATRLEGALGYDEHFGAPKRQDRIVGSLTFTQRVYEGAALAVGLSYANKPEFKSDVDQELTATLGLTYRFVNESDD